MLNIVVVGSINMDLLMQAENFANAGETIIGKKLLTLFGGKGANQAVAASRLGAKVNMIGCVGDDIFGEKLLAGLNAEKVDNKHVRIINNTASGVAIITSVHGENSIIVAPGANDALNVDDVYAAEPSFKNADVIIAQLEVPMPAVIASAKLASKYQIPFILNPAPAQKLPEKLLEHVTLLTPNQHELAQSLNVNTNDVAKLPSILRGKVIMTSGQAGAYYMQKDGTIYHQPSFKVNALDSTGAGDTFNAALAVYLARGIESAMKCACAAAAISVTRLGAQSAMPHNDELAKFLLTHQST